MPSCCSKGKGTLSFYSSREADRPIAAPIASSWRNPTVGNAEPEHVGIWDRLSRLLLPQRLEDLLGVIGSSVMRTPMAS